MLVSMVSSRGRKDSLCTERVGEVSLWATFSAVRKTESLCVRSLSS